jgi:hypothetical protein
MNNAASQTPPTAPPPPPSTKGRVFVLLAWMIGAAAISEIMSLTFGGGWIKQHNFHAVLLTLLVVVGAWRISPFPKWPALLFSWMFAIAYLAIRFFGLFYPGLYGSRATPLLAAFILGGCLFALLGRESPSG